MPDGRATPPGPPSQPPPRDGTTPDRQGDGRPLDLPAPGRPASPPASRPGSGGPAPGLGPLQLPFRPSPSHQQQRALRPRAQPAHDPGDWDDGSNNRAIDPTQFGWRPGMTDTVCLTYDPTGLRTKVGEPSHPDGWPGWSRITLNQWDGRPVPIRGDTELRYRRRRD